MNSVDQCEILRTRKQLLGRGNDVFVDFHLLMPLNWAPNHLSTSAPICKWIFQGFSKHKLGEDLEKEIRNDSTLSNEATAERSYGKGREWIWTHTTYWGGGGLSNP